MAAEAIGLIGVGLVGSALGAQLLQRGYGLVCCDIDPVKSAALSGLGATAVETPAAVAEHCERVIFSLMTTAIVREVVRSADGVVASIAAELHLEGSVKSTKKKLTWLAYTPDLVSVELYDFDHLLCKDKVEEDDKEDEIYTKETTFVDAATGEGSLRLLKKGEVIQVERRGYYICDRPYVRASDPVRLLFVPDGKNMFGVKR